MREFKITFEGEAVVRLHEDVFKVVDDEWRKSFYSLHTVEDIVEHIVFNLLEGSTLDCLDGWADQPSENARILHQDVYNIEVEER